MIGMDMFHSIYELQYYDGWILVRLGSRKTVTLFDYVKTCPISNDNLETTIPRLNRFAFSGEQFAPEWTGLIVSGNE